MTPYTAINIGPIISTLQMARKPRELWAASYLFSRLMKCIIEELKNKNLEIISPAIVEKPLLGVGLYPDRVFVKGEVKPEDFLASLKEYFFNSIEAKELSLQEKDNLWEYFNIMFAYYKPKDDFENHSVALANLNEQLNILELNNYAKRSECEVSVRKMLDYGNSPLKEFFNKEGFDTLDSIAKTELKSNPTKEKKSYHNYICVVQADGDNVGKNITNPQLGNEKLGAISKALIKFGEAAAEKIADFGGMPIYAGGDDLLFIAPVVGKDGTTIFDLLQKIDNDCFNKLSHEILDASMSYGVSVSYQKFPLYESMKTARTLLEEIAKDKYQTGNLMGKNAIAFKLQKHSGSGFNFAFSKADTEFVKKFNRLIEQTSDGNTVSAVAHKIRANDGLVKRVLEAGSDERIDALFEKVLECTGTPYFDAVKKIMPTVYKGINEHKIYVGQNKTKSETDDWENKYGIALYNILRTAKFLKGEESIDE
ncbi:MAG: Cas10/Cmr2 second palm domain-containing protein [Tannerella sp.]|uniref:Cas10/Cmr2 second palm domain-containing protein n=1 Tax=Tannerella sp. TaxID=2382127 RepID=UPI003FA1B85F